MRKILRSGTLAALAWLLSAPLVPSVAQDLPPEVLAYADLVFYNGNVTTVDEKFSIKQAIAIRGNKILKVGTDAEALRLAGPNTRKIDLKGRSVIPGLIDSHSHVQATATDRYGKELAELPGRFARMRIS
jgi:predicted amidohydrolase YtcJ